MRRTPLLLMAAVLFPAAEVSAQADVPRVYSLNVKVDPADVPTWVEHYQRYDVPALEALIEDGDLLEFDLWIHHTGGEYNLRYNYVVPDFGAVAETGGRYMQRVAPGGAASFGAPMSTVREMADERAMEEGLITAWVRLDHSIGGPWNSKTLFWLDSWNAIDDVRDLLGETASELGAPLAGSAAMRGHTDMIWTRARRFGN